MAIDVAQKIVTGDSQPRKSLAVVAVAGCKALTAAEKRSSNVLESGVKPDQDIDVMYNRLDTKFDDPTYYTA